MLRSLAAISELLNSAAPEPPKSYAAESLMKPILPKKKNQELPPKSLLKLVSYLIRLWTDSVCFHATTVGTIKKLSETLRNDDADDSNILVYLYFSTSKFKPIVDLLLLRKGIPGTDDVAILPTTTATAIRSVPSLHPLSSISTIGIP